jgi:hypothetical protein
MAEDFSEEVTNRGEKILEGVEKKNIGKICKREVTEKVEILSGMVTVMMDHLKRDKNYDKGLEKTIRHVVGMCMQKGVSIGKRYNGTPEELMKTIALIPIHPNKITRALPKKKQRLAKYILHSLLLGKFSYEAGLAISATLSEHQRRKYLKKLEEETSAYIG